MLRSDMLAVTATDTLVATDERVKAAKSLALQVERDQEIGIGDAKVDEKFHKLSRDQLKNARDGLLVQLATQMEWVIAGRKGIESLNGTVKVLQELGGIDGDVEYLTIKTESYDN